MLRIVLGVVVGFIAWMIVWVGFEKILSAIWPAFGINQKAFEEAVKNDPSAPGFSADRAMLLAQFVISIAVSLLAGVLSALIAGESSRTPLFVGCLLLVMGVAKAIMSWRYVPLWYHVIFTAILLPMAIIGGKLITTN